MNNRNSFLTVLEAEKFRIKVVAESVSGKAYLLVHRELLLTVSSHDRRSRDLSGASFRRTLMPFTRPPSS